MAMSSADQARRIRRWPIWVTLVVAYLAVVAVGLISLPPMVGDEVTHFHLLRNQAAQWPRPTFKVLLPAPWTESGSIVQYYPHTALWHYVLAVPYRLAGDSVIMVQLVHVLFLVQLLAGVFYVFRRQGRLQFAGWVAVCLVLSQPMTLLFGVTFYQDIPAAAQIVWAFACLVRGRWMWGALFLALALNIKENAVLFLPGYGLSMLWVFRGQWRKLLRSVCVTACVVLLSCGIAVAALRSEGHTYFPLQNLTELTNRVVVNARSHLAARRAAEVPEAARKRQRHGCGKEPRPLSLYSAGVVANHPGDLRCPKNWLIYGGGILPLALLGSLLAAVLPRKRRTSIPCGTRAGMGVFACAGVSYLGLTYYMLRTSPDARFFYPGIVLCALPVAASLTRLPFRRVWFPLLCAASLIQSSGVLAKTYSLRRVPKGILETIAYFEENPPTLDRIFMYPEGSYQLFSLEHDWYLGNRLLSFWAADNDARLHVLRNREIGAIVIKKHLIADDERAAHNLGSYPISFVRDIRNDPRFERVLDNDAAEVYRVLYGQ